MRDNLWGLADEIGWMRLADQDKSRLYEDWSKRDDVGGVLSRYLAPEAIRVYVKDTLMKPYVRDRLGNPAAILDVCGVEKSASIAKNFIKPHGVRLVDGRILGWGQARDWKLVLFGVFERAYLHPGSQPFAAVLLHPSGRTREHEYRNFIDESRRRFGIDRLLWIDD